MASVVADVSFAEGLLTSVWLTIQSIPNGHQESRTSTFVVVSVPSTYLSRVNVPCRSRTTRGVGIRFKAEFAMGLEVLAGHPRVRRLTLLHDRHLRTMACK